MLVTYIIEIERESGVIAVEKGGEILKATGAKSVLIRYNEEIITVTNTTSDEQKTD